MKLLINQLYIIVIILLNVNLLFPQNDVCLNIQNNPYPFSPALNAFSKYINILDCFHIYAEPAISDQKVLHAASIVAELLDNNEDGIVDDPLLEHQLRNSQAMMPLFSSEWSSAMDDVWNYYNGCTSAALFNNEIDPSQPGHWGDDASVEEILHTINHCGHVEIYPDAFNLLPNSSILTESMDIARGGQFINVPNQYPEEAWYHYDDWTCDYQCMAIEYFYWSIVANMGLLNDIQTCNGIYNEWELCTPELFQTTDIMMYSIIADPQYLIPQNKPDGNYCPSENYPADINNDGMINILDIIQLVNIVLSSDNNNHHDLNEDGILNILDIIYLVNIIQAK